MTEGQEGAKKTLNKDKPEINRGVELLLRNKRRKKKPKPKKTFQVECSFFKWEITFYLNIKKKESLEEE